MTQAQKKHASWLEYGPLLLFFITNYFKGIMWGTAVLVLATALALAYSWLKYRKIPMMALVGGVAVAFFGGLTLYFNDEFFIKIKPTVISLLFALVLVVGQVSGRNILKILLAGQMNMAEEGWYKLGWLWSAMFVTSALANEIAWRSLSTDGWVAFKAFGLTGISMLFALASIPVFKKYSTDLNA